MFNRPWLVTAGLLPMISLAQTPQGPKTPPVIDYPARVQSVENLKQHIAQREARFESLKQDLRALDDRAEKQLADILKTLATLTDSNESKTRVARTKGDVIEALLRTIGIYRGKRMDVFERLRRNPHEPKEQLEKEIAIYDERVNRRIGQIVDLARSLPGYRDVPKYESEGTSYWNGWSAESTRISDDWRQNQRGSNAGESQRKELLQEVTKSLERCQYRRAALADTLANRKLSARERAVQEEELGRIDANLDNLRQRRRELALPGAGASHAIGRDEAHDAEQMLDDARADLAGDMWDVMRKFGELDREGTRIWALKENLKAREEWLKNNPPPNPATPANE